MIILNSINIKIKIYKYIEENSKNKKVIELVKINLFDIATGPIHYNYCIKKVK
jgi:hypothetical protein